MIKGDYVSLARVPNFSSSAWGRILNDKCTAGYVVVGYDSEDMQFRVKVRCELVSVLIPPKFNIGDKIKMADKNAFNDDHVFTINELAQDAEANWRYGGRAGIYSFGGQRERDLVSYETA